MLLINIESGLLLKLCVHIDLKCVIIWKRVKLPFVSKVGLSGDSFMSSVS